MTAAGNSPMDKRWDEYIERGDWKCPKHGEGAHWWIITDSLQTCKYCKAKKPVSTESSVAELKRLMRFTKPVPKSWARSRPRIT